MVPTELAFLKPWLTALAMPPMLGIVLAALGLLLVLRQRRRMGSWLALLGLGSLWLVSCNAFAVWMAQTLLAQVPALDLATAARTLQQQQVQAVVVLGGGVQSRSREYLGAQPHASTAERLHYGVVLARSAGLPLAFSGGAGWAADRGTGTEAQSAQRWLSQTGMGSLRWTESSSRDTRENAALTSALLRQDGVTRIALVTHAWHMPRAQRAFQQAGLSVVPAPMGYIEPVHTPGLEWLPSEYGLRNSRQILRELLGSALGQ